MSEENKTHLSDKHNIMSEFWVQNKNEAEFEDFFDYNDLGFPLSYAISYGIVESTKLAESIIEETWNLFMEALEIEDTGFETLYDVLTTAWPSVYPPDGE